MINPGGSNAADDRLPTIPAPLKFGAGDYPPSRAAAPKVSQSQDSVPVDTPRAARRRPQFGGAAPAPAAGSGSSASGASSRPGLKPPTAGPAPRRPRVRSASSGDLAAGVRHPSPDKRRIACFRCTPVTATNSSRIVLFAALSLARYRAPIAAVTSARAAMLILPAIPSPPATDPPRGPRDRHLTGILRSRFIRGNAGPVPDVV